AGRAAAAARTGEPAGRRPDTRRPEARWSWQEGSDRTCLVAGGHRIQDPLSSDLFRASIMHLMLWSPAAHSFASGYRPRKTTGGASGDSTAANRRGHWDCSADASAASPG